ncbi:hypothetical protein AB0G60_31100 [Streptomyces angustmyceticus]|uniref:Uncharacterized protein n=1 Tax=Streptomyces angustmyceticus TaxID=285578 RepID=A0A5J4LND4_9ACTN|nr:hypothetical protein [Streptomyces angustmyceticus]UAL68976.1 hypothetical protein K7396_22600 [Streptomyces angustmyceticus]GES34024.1 hypothetical protein San01_65120 [Streptomyces angustmyceticus]
MHRPSVPEDLDHPERLWARAATLAVVAAAVDDWDEFSWGGQGLQCWNDGGSYWWRLKMFEDGRALLCGQDSDGSHTHSGGRQIDFLAGGPAWLPWERLREDAEGNLFGFVYWWQDGAWARAPYPEKLPDDGLEMSMSWVAPGDDAARHIAEVLVARTETEVDALAAVRAFLAAAEARTVAAQDITALLDTVRGQDCWYEVRPAAALAFAARLGLTAGSRGGVAVAS